MYSCRHGNPILLNKAVGPVARSKPTRDSKVGKIHGATKLGVVDVISNKEFTQYIVSESKVGTS